MEIKYDPILGKLREEDEGGDGAYVMQFGSVSSNISDNATLYFGNMAGGGLGSEQYQRIHVPKDGTITKVYLNIVVIGTLGSDENASVSLRLNNTTDYLISNAVKFDAANAVISKVDLDIDVSAGDFFDFKLVGPEFVTNPLGVRLSGNVLFE